MTKTINTVIQYWVVIRIQTRHEYQTDHFFPMYFDKDNENQPDLELLIIKFLIATKAAIEHLASIPALTAGPYH